MPPRATSPTLRRSCSRWRTTTRSPRRRCPRRLRLGPLRPRRPSLVSARTARATRAPRRTTRATTRNPELVARLFLSPTTRRIRGRRRNFRGDPRFARHRRRPRPRDGDPRPPRRRTRSRSVSSAVPLPEPRRPRRRFLPIPRVPPLVPPRHEPRGGSRRSRRGRSGARRARDGEESETTRQEGEAAIETTRARHKHHGRRRLRQTADHHAARALHADRPDGRAPIASHRRVVRGRRRRRARGRRRRPGVDARGALETGRGRHRAPRLSVHVPRAEPIRTRPRGVGVIAAQLPGVVRARPRRGGKGIGAGAFARRTIRRGRARRRRHGRRGTTATFERRRGDVRVGQRSRERRRRGGW